MNLLTPIAVAALCLSPVVAFAQTEASTQTAVEAVVIAAQDPNVSVLPAGSNVRVRLLSTLSSQDNKVGQQFDIEVVEDVLLNGRVIIARGSIGTGELTLVKKKGMWGKSGKLDGRFISVRSNGRDIPIRGTLNDKGSAGGVGAVGAALLFLPAGFFVTGTSAEISAGTSFQTKTESDTPVSFAQ
jgi:hypothetical protein